MHTHLQGHALGTEVPHLPHHQNGCFILMRAFPFPLSLTLRGAWLLHLHVRVGYSKGKLFILLRDRYATRRIYDSLKHLRFLGQSARPAVR